MGFAVSSRSSTERLVDFSSGKRSVSPRFLGLFLGCLFCFCAWLYLLVWLWKTHGFLLSPILQHVGTKAIRFDDRLSLERARHELKKDGFINLTV